MTRLTEVFNSLEQWSLTFLAPETDTVEGNFSIGQGRGDPRDGFRMITLGIICSYWLDLCRLPIFQFGPWISKKGFQLATPIKRVIKSMGSGARLSGLVFGLRHLLVVFF